MGVRKGVEEGVGRVLGMIMMREFEIKGRKKNKRGSVRKCFIFCSVFI
jgi:hypothetical protein